MQSFRARSLWSSGLRVNIAQLWNMSKKTIIALAVLDTPFFPSPKLGQELGQGTWTTAGCRVTMCSRLRNKAAGGFQVLVQVSKLGQVALKEENT